MIEFLLMNVEGVMEIQDTRSPLSPQGSLLIYVEMGMGRDREKVSSRLLVDYGA